MINEETKAGWNVLRVVPVAIDPVITVGYKDPLPDGIASMQAGTKSVIKIAAFSASANDTTVIGNLWGFRADSNIAEEICSLTLTVGTSACSVNPLNPTEAGTFRFVDTIAVANNVWDLDTGELSVASAGQGANKIGYFLLDLFGLSGLYFQKTGGTATEDMTLIYTYLNR